MTSRFSPQTCYMLAVLAAGLFLPSPATAQEHPRLFLSPEKVSAMKAAIAVKGSHHAEAFAALRAQIDEQGRQPYDPASGNWNYPRAYAARGAGLLYRLTGDKKYAQLAFDLVTDIMEKPGRDKRLPDQVKTYGLAKATVGEGIALAYDWCYDAWSDQQRAYAEDVLKRSLDVWPKYGHAQLSVDRGSNWVAVCRGGELVMMLASYEDRNRPDRLKYLVRNLQRHMAISYGPGGVSQEGIGYAGYGGIYLLEACYALADAGDDTLVKELGRHAFWKLLMYSGSSIMSEDGQRRYIQQGVSGTTINDEGWSSQAISSVPKENLPEYLWFYDRQMGRLAPGKPSQKYDNDRAAWIWALIHYPSGAIDARDPAASLGHSHFDEKTGAYFFRNRWKDENDVLVAIFTDLANHKAWDKREATGIRLLAHGSAFFGGPCKGKEAGTFSRLLVDGKSEAGKDSGKNGQNILAEARPDGGYVIAGGGSTYKDLGLKDLRRHLLVDFAADKNAALLSTLDLIESDGEHTYTWNANLGDDKSDGGIKATAGSEDGRPTFLLTGKNGWVKGWTLHPADARLKADDPLQIETKAKDTAIWVVMLTGEGKPPVGRVSGKGLDSVLTVDGAEVRYDATKDRIVVE